MLGKEVPAEGLHMTLPLLQREWAAAEEERCGALRRLQEEHQVCFGCTLDFVCTVYVYPAAPPLFVSILTQT